MNHENIKFRITDVNICSSEGLGGDCLNSASWWIGGKTVDIDDIFS